MKVAIVDDETLARRRMRQLLQQHGDVDVVWEAAGPGAARELLRDVVPTALFLDIEMRNASGFDVLLDMPDNVAVVFVTAFSAYAVEAFEFAALDYLLKPVSQERLGKTLDRVRQFADRRSSACVVGLDEQLCIRSGRRLKFVRARDIVMIAAAGPYSELTMVNGGTLLATKTTQAWEALLPRSTFRRATRAMLVNVGHVGSAELSLDGRFRLHLKNGSTVTMSRRYSREFRRGGNIGNRVKP